MAHPKTLGSILATTGRGGGFGNLMIVYGLRKRWPAIVGQALAQHSVVDGLSKRTLYIRVESSAWLVELKMLHADLLQALRRALREEVTTKNVSIDKLAFKVGALPSPSKAPPAVPDRSGLGQPTKPPLARIRQEVRFLPYWLLNTLERLDEGQRSSSQTE